MNFLKSTSLNVWISSDLLSFYLFIAFASSIGLTFQLANSSINYSNSDIVAKCNRTTGIFVDVFT
jgi:hypothetical protein